MKTGRDLFEIWAYGTPLLWEHDLTDRDRMRWHYLANDLDRHCSVAQPTAETDLLDARVTALENTDLLESRVKALEEIVTKYRPSYEEVQRMIDTTPLKVGDKVTFNWYGMDLTGELAATHSDGSVVVVTRNASQHFSGHDPIYNLRRA